MTGENVQSSIEIDVWSDMQCPFCYMGDTLLSQAVAELEDPESVVVRYHSYQLNPHLAADAAIPQAELLEREKRMPRERVDAMTAQIAERGAALGIEYHFDRVLAVNTRSAHRLSHFAREHGVQHELMQRLFRATFTEGLNLGDHAVLADLAAEVGLDRDAALKVLGSDAFAEDVAADQSRARSLGVQGVPFFVINGKYAISGAQPLETFRRVLEQSRGEAVTA